MTPEKVHGILGYYDGILDGVADFRGSPQAFVLDGEIDAESPRYRLKPLTPEQFALFSEYWRFWRRWEEAFHRGDVPPTTPPVLSEDRARHDEIEPVVKAALAIPEQSALAARGTFRPAAHANRERDGRWGGFEVVWTLV
jgi:hypothetical protein